MTAHPQFILYIATTLDGYIAAADGGIDWLTSFNEEGADTEYQAFYREIDALIMGASTYEQVLTFGDWPYPDKQSYVLTHRSLTSDREDITFFHDLDAALIDIERRGFKRVWLVGGGQLAAEFMRRGWIHEWILTIAPIILGDGISLYQTVPMQALQLMNTRHFLSGMVKLHYRTPLA